MSDLYKQFASALEARMASFASQAVDGVPAQLGMITESGGLLLDGFKREITDYLTADWLVQLHLPAFSLLGTTSAPVNASGQGGTASQRMRFDFEAAEIGEIRLNWKSGIQPGDRVLAIPANGGNDAVILCRVVS